MKDKIKLCVIISILFSLMTMFVTTNVFAAETRTNENNVVTTSEDVNKKAEENTVTSEENSEEDIYYGDLYVLFNENDDYNNSTYIMDKNVDGNVFIFGQDVRITGRINGSLFVFSSTLTVEQDAYIGSHIFAYADKITMSGFTYDAYLAATEVNLSKEGTVYRDMKIFSDTAYLFGSIGRDLDIVGNNITIYENEDNSLYTLIIHQKE